MVYPYSDQQRTELGDGLSRRILAHAPSLMLVEVSFETGAIGTVHSHVHEQIAYVKEGQFEFEVDGHKTILRAGDSVFLPSAVPHGAVCLEKGIIHDIFTPERSDFLS